MAELEEGGELGLEEPPLDEPGELPVPTALLVLSPDGDEPGFDEAL